MEENEWPDNASIQSQIVQRRIIFNSIEDLLESSNALRFLSLQSIHIRYKGTALQITLEPLLEKLHFQQTSKSITLDGMSQDTPNRENTKDHILQT